MEGFRYGDVQFIIIISYRFFRIFDVECRNVELQGNATQLNERIMIMFT